MPYPNKQPWIEWDFPNRVGTGRVSGVVAQTTFGNNLSVGLSMEDVWFSGGTLYFLSSAETIDLVSDSSSDDGSPAGTGAQTISVFGLDGDYNPVQETVIMNGTTPVTTSAAFLRVNRMVVTAVGSNEVNVGTITATASSSATTQAEMGPAYGATSKSQITVPNG